MVIVRTLKITGPAGTGIKSAGLLLQKIIKANGYYSHGYTEYPSLIRGGDNTYQIDFSAQPVRSSANAEGSIDILVALTKECLAAHTSELSKNSVALVKSPEGTPDISKEQLLVIPVAQILKDNELPPIMENTIYVGAVAGILNFEIEGIKNIVAEAYKNFADQNMLAIEKGYTIGQNLNGRFTLDSSTPRQIENSANDQLLTANEAVAKAFIDAKGEFFTSYPMTPATSILHALAAQGPKEGILVRQASSEIEAIGLCAGASYAGKRCMTATSGGGFALMTEFVSLLGEAEIPLLIVNSQRPAPATGLPTWTEQGDLLFATFAGHGDLPKVVVAPADPTEAYYLTADALNLAEKYQIPVIMLLDKNLSESVFTTQQFDKAKITVDRGQILENQNANLANAPFARYSLDTKTGTSTRALPGTPGGIHLTNSDEHDELGYSIDAGETRNKMMEKRMRKLESIQSILPRPKIYGDENADTIVIGWGSTKGVILNAIEDLAIDGQNFMFMQIQYLWPFPEKEVLNDLTCSISSNGSSRKKIVLVENNYSAQLGTLLKMAGITVDKTITKYDGRPFFRNELISKLKNT